MTDIRATKGAFQVVAAAEGGSVEVQKGSVQAVYNFPAEGIRTTYGNFTAVVSQGVPFRATSASIQVVCLGRVAYPNVLSWTATLDGHDYYFLQLQEITLVYDFHAGQWYNWGTESRNLWRAQIGANWNGNMGYINKGASGYNVSNILVGDNTTGALYFLDPTKNTDDDPEYLEAPLPFQRLVYGQIITRGHDYVACNGIELSGSIGEDVAAPDVTVTLSYSDDQGHSFVAADQPVPVSVGSYHQVVQWRSLGSIRGPGRLIKIEDYGGLFRIDGIDLNDDQERPNG